VRTVRRGGRLAVVEGEAGIGKTRLVEAALQTARDTGVAVLAAKAEELESHRPFGPIVDCAGRERLEAHLGAWDLRPDVGGERQFRIAESVLELLDELLRVVRLVAERLTNPEIAERMFISRRTVQTHVSHAVAKVGVATRRELATEAARHTGWQLRVEPAGEETEVSPSPPRAR
jgi:predicted ATPase